MYLFHQCMVDFFNKLKFNDHKYQTNVTVRDENYEGKLLSPMKDFVLFGIDCQSVCLI